MAPGPRSFINPQLSHAGSSPGSCGGWQLQSRQRLQDGEPARRVIWLSELEHAGDAGREKKKKKKQIWKGAPLRYGKSYYREESWQLGLGFVFTLVGDF